MKKILSLIAAALLVSGLAWADTKISQMPSGGALTTGDIIPILRSGANYQATYTPPVTGVLTLTGDGVVFNNSASVGAVTLSLANVASNNVFAGPASGIAVSPSYRALVPADLPLSSTWAMTAGLGITTSGGTALAATATGAGNTGYAGFFTNTSTAGYAGYFTGTVGLAGNAFSVPNVPTLSTATFTANFASSNHFQFVLVHASCPCTIANPTNPVSGQTGVIEIDQSATGSDTVTWGGSYKFASATAPTLSTSASAVDLFGYYVKDSTHIIVGSGVLNAH